MQTIQTPRSNPDFVAALKASVPPRDRRWNGTAWEIADSYAPVAQRLFAQYFPARPVAQAPVLASELPAGLARPRGGRQTRAWRLAVLKHWLGGDGALMLAALRAIWLRQTADERTIEATTHDNGMGFSGVDGTILTSFGNQVERGRPLSARQWEVLAKCLPRYAGQILTNGLLDIEDRLAAAFEA